MRLTNFKHRLRSAILKFLFQPPSIKANINPPRLARIIGEYRVYLIDSQSYRHWIPDGPTLEGIGGDWEQIEQLMSWDELSLFPPRHPLPSHVGGPRSWLVKVRGETDIYFINDEYERMQIFDTSVLKAASARDRTDILVSWDELEKFKPLKQ